MFHLFLVVWNDASNFFWIRSLPPFYHQLDKFFSWMFLFLVWACKALFHSPSINLSQNVWNWFHHVPYMFWRNWLARSWDALALVMIGEHENSRDVYQNSKYYHAGTWNYIQLKGIKMGLQGTLLLDWNMKYNQKSSNPMAGLKLFRNYESRTMIKVGSLSVRNTIRLINSGKKYPVIGVWDPTSCQPVTWGSCKRSKGSPDLCFWR